MTALVLRGDARHLPLPDASVDLIVTSPPYWKQRDYQDQGKSYAGQMGSEPTWQQWLEALLECTREMIRVLKPTGSIFVDLADKYSAKDLLLLPERYRIACKDQLGLIPRKVIIWSKPNPIPESAKDRVRSSHEDWVHLVKQPRYYTAVDEIREATQDRGPGLTWQMRLARGDTNRQGEQRGTFGHNGMAGNSLGKLPGSVWSIASEPFNPPKWEGNDAGRRVYFWGKTHDLALPKAERWRSVAPGRVLYRMPDHFAAFPTEWPRRLILGWSPPGICSACGQGRRPVRDVDWSKVPHRLVEKRALTPDETATWCADFADWCASAGVGRVDLDYVAGTSDMGGWWASRLPHRSQVPTPEQWAKLRVAFDPPARFDELVHLQRLIPVSLMDGGDNAPVTGRHETDGHRRMASSEYQHITGYACACPEPTAPTRPAVILDPFGGTGTTALVAHALGRVGITVDMSADYSRLARWRTSDRGELAKAMRVPKPAPVPDGQLDMFSEVTG